MANPEHLDILKQGVEVWNKWREENKDIDPDLIGANLIGANLIGANLSRANLSAANLRETDLSIAFLDGANLSAANLRQVNLSEANLSAANLSAANLSGADLWGADLSEAILSEANLSKANLSRANLSRADLSLANLSRAIFSGANLSGADLSEINFSGVDLSRANLSKVQMLGTNLEKTTLTGACIQDWNINSETNLKNTECDYIFLKSGWNREKKRDAFSERRPHQKDKNFEPGDFERLVRKSQETIDLIFRNGIDWQAFLNSYEQLKVEAGGDFFPVQSIENRDDGSFIVRLKSPPGTDKEATEKFFEERYQAELKLIEARYKQELQLKDVEIEGYKRENTNITAITKLLANQPINVAMTNKTLLSGKN
jgi:uncharacterized protein YjbI with pentapeptide repeats